MEGARPITYQSSFSSSEEDLARGFPVSISCIWDELFCNCFPFTDDIPVKDDDALAALNFGRAVDLFVQAHGSCSSDSGERSLGVRVNFGLLLGTSFTAAFTAAFDVAPVS